MMSQEIAELLQSHIKRRPEARVQDVYKLLYQGVFGVGHIVSDKALEVLKEEAGRINLDDHPEDPLFESVSPDGSMVRVNLRQYIKQGGNLDTLYKIMQESAKHQGDPSVFLDYWAQFKRLVATNVLSFSVEEIQRIDDIIVTDGVKPRHHTEQYREAYYPAYRVVLWRIYREMAGLVGSVKNYST